MDGKHHRHPALRLLRPVQPGLDRKAVKGAVPNGFRFHQFVFGEVGVEAAGHLAVPAAPEVELQQVAGEPGALQHQVQEIAHQAKAGKIACGQAEPAGAGRALAPRQQHMPAVVVFHPEQGAVVVPHPLHIVLRLRHRRKGALFQVVIAQPGELVVLVGEHIEPPARGVPVHGDLCHLLPGRQQHLAFAGGQVHEQHLGGFQVQHRDGQEPLAVRRHHLGHQLAALLVQQGPEFPAFQVVEEQARKPRVLLVGKQDHKPAVGRDGLGIKAVEVVQVPGEPFGPAAGLEQGHLVALPALEVHEQQDAVGGFQAEPNGPLLVKGQAFGAPAAEPTPPQVQLPRVVGHIEHLVGPPGRHPEVAEQLIGKKLLKGAHPAPPWFSAGVR